jgi:long-chain acyl-CoA synthetase
LITEPENSLHPSWHAKTHPEKPACIMAGSGQVLTYRELEDRSNQVAQMFRALGLVAGDHVAILLENHLRYFEICFGAHRAGLIYTALSSRLTASEAAYIIEDCQAKVLITSVALAVLAQALVALTPQLEARLLIDAPPSGGLIDAAHQSYQPYEATLARYPASRIADESAGGDMLYSSGTTGRPKGVFVPPDGAAIDASNPQIEIARQAYQMGFDSIYLSPAPLYHAAPLRFTMLALRLGASCVIMEHFEAEAFLRLIEQYQVTHSQLVPTMFVRMLKLDVAVREKYRLTSLRCAIHAAAPCPIPVKQQMIDWWGPILWEYYAGTEGNGVTMVHARDWLKYPGTVGKAVVGQLRICDEQYQLVANGVAGTIYFADGRAFSYHNDAQKTAESRHPLGWTTLGDVGYVNDEGFLFLTDRKAHMIISGGVNIYPQECEDLLITHPKVLDCAVIGVPNDDFGEEVKAVVQPRDMRDVADGGHALALELLAFCRARLSAIKCPRSVDFEAELPRHATGKLYKRVLRDRYWAGRASKLV